MGSSSSIPHSIILSQINKFHDYIEPVTQTQLRNGPAAGDLILEKLLLKGREYKSSVGAFRLKRGLIRRIHFNTDIVKNSGGIVSIEDLTLLFDFTKPKSGNSYQLRTLLALLQKTKSSATRIIEFLDKFILRVQNVHIRMEECVNGQNFAFGVIFGEICTRNKDSSGLYKCVRFINTGFYLDELTWQDGLVTDTNFSDPYLRFIKGWRSPNNPKYYLMFVSSADVEITKTEPNISKVKLDFQINFSDICDKFETLMNTMRAYQNPTTAFLGRDYANTDESEFIRSSSGNNFVSFTHPFLLIAFALAVFVVLSNNI